MNTDYPSTAAIARWLTPSPDVVDASRSCTCTLLSAGSPFDPPEWEQDMACAVHGDGAYMRAALVMASITLERVHDAVMTWATPPDTAKVANGCNEGPTAAESVAIAAEEAGNGLLDPFHDGDVELVIRALATHRFVAGLSDATEDAEEAEQAETIERRLAALVANGWLKP